MTAVDFADVVNPTDVFVTDLTRDAHFAMEPPQRSAVTEQMVRQELERDRLAQFQIVGAINFAHAAAPQQPNDSITLSQKRPGYESSIINRIKRY